MERIKALLPNWMTDEAKCPKKSAKPLPPYVHLKGHKKEPKAHFHDVGAKLVNCTLPDSYAERARAADIALEERQIGTPPTKLEPPRPSDSES